MFYFRKSTTFNINGEGHEIAILITRIQSSLHLTNSEVELLLLKYLQIIEIQLSVKLTLNL